MPLSIIGVNHLKMMGDESGALQRNIPGGTAVKFAETFEIQSTGHFQKVYKHYAAAFLKLETFKNSLGAKRRKLDVEMRWWYVIDEATGIPRQYTAFDWHTATTQLLLNLKGETKSKVDDILDLHENDTATGGGDGMIVKRVWSEKLGVPRSETRNPCQIGMMLESRPDLLDALYTALDINRHPFFQPGISYQEQLLGLERVARQAEYTEDQMRLAGGIAPILDHALGKLPTEMQEEDTTADEPL